MPGTDGLGLLRRITAQHPGCICILLTAYGSVQTAVDAMKQGAYDFIEKPFNIDQLLVVIRRAMETARLRRASKPDAETPPPSIESLADGLVTKAGADPRAVRLVDGSGLSRLNLVTAQSVVQVLRYAYGQPYRDVLIRALPVAGNDGTLRRRMQGTRAAGNMRAKTGTLNAVSGLSGYVTAPNGEPLVFSILMNNFLTGPQQARAAQDRIGVLLSELDL